MGWTKEEREKFDRLEKKFRSLQKHSKNLEGALKEIVTETKKVQDDNNFLRSQINVIHYKRDSLEQHGRRGQLRASIKFLKMIMKMYLNTISFFLWRILLN